MPILHPNLQNRLWYNTSNDLFYWVENDVVYCGDIGIPPGETDAESLWPDDLVEPSSAWDAHLLESCLLRIEANDLAYKDTLFIEV